MRKHLRLLALGIPMVLVASNSSAAAKAGSSCSKVGIKSVAAGKTYTCVKSGRKLVWDKGVLIPVAQPSQSASATPAPSPTESAKAKPSPTPTVVPVAEGDSCPKMGQQTKNGSTLLECRKFAGNKLQYIAITNNFSLVVNPESPDPLNLCQLPDKRTVIPVELQNNIPLAIAYPPKPFPNFGSATGTFKVVVVGVDFSDTPGKGLPSDIWKDDIAKASDWMTWYTNGKVKLDFVTYPEWLRAPKPSFSYDASNNGSRGPNDTQSGGLTAQQISDDYIHTIEKTADLTNALSVWVYLPTDITTPFGAFQPASAGVQSLKYGFVKSQLVLTSADMYLSNRLRYSYFLHEMIHGFGLQGHSSKFIPTDGYLNKNGIMSNADGWNQALLPWDAIVWGVATPVDTYCIDKSHLTSVDLKLVPLEREQKGLRSAIIKLNDHQALVVESHRSDKYGIGEGAGFAGTMVTIVDTTKSTAFESDTSPRDPCITSTGVYLSVEGGNHGRHVAIGTPLMRNGQNYNGVTMYNGISIAGDQDNWDLNHIMYPGDSITSVGVKITLVKGGDNDVVRLEVIDKSVNEYVQPLVAPECLARLVPISQSSSGSRSLVASKNSANNLSMLPILNFATEAKIKTKALKSK